MCIPTLLRVKEAALERESAQHLVIAGFFPIGNKANIVNSNPTSEVKQIDITDAVIPTTNIIKIIMLLCCLCNQDVIMDAEHLKTCIALKAPQLWERYWKARDQLISLRT